MAHDVQVAVTGQPDAPADAGPSVLRDCEDAAAYVGSVCFKHGPPRPTGVELEWLLHRPTVPDTPVDVAPLVAALGPHAPTTIEPSAPARPLPAGSTVTVEPGGQVELAGRPLPALDGLLTTVRADTAALHALLAAHGPQPRAADPSRSPTRLLKVQRYRAMEEAFDRIGPHLEVRYVDTQPGDGWALPTAVLAALVGEPDRVLEHCEPARDRWVQGARHGLDDPHLAPAATGVFTLAGERLVGAPAWVRDPLIEMTECRMPRGRCPADDPAPGDGHPVPVPTSDPDTPEGELELPLLTPAETRAYVREVRDKALDALSRSPMRGRRLEEHGFAFGMIVQHDQQHDETMLAPAAAGRTGTARRPAAARVAPAARSAPTGRCCVRRSATGTTRSAGRSSPASGAPVTPARRRSRGCAAIWLTSGRR